MRTRPLLVTAYLLLGACSDASAKPSSAAPERVPAAATMWRASRAPKADQTTTPTNVEQAPSAATPPTFEGVDAALASQYEKTLPRSSQQAWRVLAPQVRRAYVASTVDGSRQPLLFYDSGSARKKPLLVVLHSWSADYRQALNIPYAEWAVRSDWVFVQPDFRGANTRPEATASELAVQDVVDAINYAKAHANVDKERIYLTGYSGGGMMALVMAAQHPELWAGVVAWAPVVDLLDWYAHNRQTGHSRYAREIAASCGGAPRPSSRAAAECQRRSPRSLLARAKEVSFPIYIAHGLEDRTVKPSHALWAYNALARSHPFASSELELIGSRHELPPGLAQAPKDELFARAGAPLRLVRSSGNVTLALFEGGHDIVYNAGLRWLAEARRR